MNIFERPLRKEITPEPTSTDNDEEIARHADRPAVPDESIELFEGLKEDVVRTLRKILVYGGILVAAGTAHKQVAEYIFDTNHDSEYQTVEDMKARERKLKEAFGDFEVVGEIRNALESEKSKFVYQWPFVSDKRTTPASEQHAEHERAEQKPDVEIVGNPGGLSRQEVENILQWLPWGWTEDVGKIEQTDTDREDNQQYGLKSASLASATIAAFGNKACITFYKCAKKYDPLNNMSVLFHEVAHANDWASDSRMTGVERADLLLQVADRLDDDDRFESQYVESIHNEDKQREKYLKACEYWAEISSAYFKEPGFMNIKDFAIVDSHVRATDPDFKNNLLYGEKSPFFGIVERISKEEKAESAK